MLIDTAVGDAGLEHLRNLKSLRRLHIRRTNVTDEGVARLQQASPTAPSSGKRIARSRPIDNLPRRPYNDGVKCGARIFPLNCQDDVP